MAGATTDPKTVVGALLARARAAQRLANTYDQQRVDELVTAAAWAIIEPQRNLELAQLAVRDTGIGNVADKVRKNHRKTLGLLRDLQGALSVGVITQDNARGLTEIARPVGVVCAVTPSTNPAATPANRSSRESPTAGVPPSSTPKRSPICSNRPGSGLRQRQASSGACGQ